MGAILPEHQADLADDTQEFYDRVQQRETAEPGKSIKDIAIDIADRRAGNERVRKERQLAINQYKKENDIRTKEDAQERIEDVLEAFEEGRLSQEEADSQIIILEQLEGLLK